MKTEVVRKAAADVSFPDLMNGTIAEIVSVMNDHTSWKPGDLVIRSCERVVHLAGAGHNSIHMTGMRCRPLVAGDKVTLTV